MKRDDEEEDLLEKIAEHEAKVKAYEDEKQQLLLDQGLLYAIVTSVSPTSINIIKYDKRLDPQFKYCRILLTE